MTLSTIDAMQLGAAVSISDRSTLPQMRAEAEAKVPGSTFMGEVIARALGGLTVDGTIDYVLGIKITAAIAEAAVAVYYKEQTQAITLEDTLNNIKVTE